MRKKRNLLLQYRREIAFLPLNGAVRRTVNRIEKILIAKQRNSVAPDLPDYIMRRDYVAAALRTARDLGAGEKEWAAFVEELKRRKG